MPKKQWQTNTKWIEIKIEKPKKLTKFFFLYIKLKTKITFWKKCVLNSRKK